MIRGRNSLHREKCQGTTFAGISLPINDLHIPRTVGALPALLSRQRPDGKRWDLCNGSLAKWLSQRVSTPDLPRDDVAVRDLRSLPLNTTDLVKLSKIFTSPHEAKLR